jgi:hypothetical protein
MGLDIYLYKYNGMKPFKNYEEARASFAAMEAKITEATSILDPEWEKLKDTDHNDARREVLREKGIKVTKATIKGSPWENSISKYGDIEFTAEERIEIDSIKHQADHMFKIGYFRSSYNDGGINSVLKNNGLDDLYGIFYRTRDDDYNFKPDWKKALKKVKEVIKAYEPFAKEGLACTHVYSHTMISSEKEALDIFRKEAERNKDGKSILGGGWYSNAAGNFYFGDKPMKVRAVISGKNCIGIPGAYLVYDTGGDEDGPNWYLTSLKIVQETIEYVLNKPDADDYYFHWSE